MAGDWIPIRTNIHKVREVIAIAQQTKKSRFEVVGQLIAFWGWVQNETSTGVIVDVDVDALVDALALHRSFFDALINVGWLAESNNGKKSITVPNFEVWLSRSAKARIQRNKRQSRWRAKDKNVDALVDAYELPQNRTEQNSTLQKKEDLRSFDLKVCPAPPQSTGKVPEETLPATLPTEPLKELPRSSNPLFTQRAPRIYLSDAEVFELTKLAEGQSFYNQELQKASDWMLAKGKLMKDHAAFMRNWIRKAKAQAERNGKQKLNTFDLNKQKLMEIAERERAAKKG